MTDSDERWKGQERAARRDQPVQLDLGANPLAPEFRDAVRSNDPGVWDDLCTGIGQDVYTIPFLQPEACVRLAAEVDRRAKERPPKTPPNSMHSYGAVLEDLGLGPFLGALHEEWFQPLAERRFGPYGAGSIDGVHGFIADYAAGQDEDLGFHVDDSAYTLNVCISGDFRGSELYFGGPRCDVHMQSYERQGEEFEYDHKIGTAVLHAGRHRHGVHPLLSGQRRNLIVWFQSSQAKEAAKSCPDWCAEHR